MRELLLVFIENNAEEIRVSDKLQAKIERHYAMTNTLLEHYKVATKLDKPFIEYARYVLTRGSFTEQHALAESIQQKIQLKTSRLSFTE
ncbi:hypothetical protein A3A68_01055 [Candidatus Saccharibacteria bacterium RIFCSPLOWO2_01_FULL_48_13]|nr:MAG: hypothetical protein A2884_01185 [Candidatus Saccharibacteria bacterium RIFCSPHIGHO2_01_FULL_48_12]OGL35456.1 MAG: hypothetical protein A3F38_02690 [Candidatus Saccharibacteria bacterium RIFCSPHIGHO2_12_FULL_48_21]OGL37027.1 MAG: hypothetical protein A3A68_01055 [Candidatus Saccharibacteria bacterium RIFCSPLOWO2_01_FULL_48_13]